MSELDHMDGLAAEYVLGTLDFEEREQARVLLDADAAFAAKVETWERRFGDLYLMVEPVEPDSAIWPRIKARMLDTREQTRGGDSAVPAPAPLAMAGEPPSLEAIEAVISETATTLSSEATSTAPQQAAPAPITQVIPTSAAEAAPASVSEPPASEAAPAPASEETSSPGPELPPAPTLETTGTSAVEASPSLAVGAASAEPVGQAAGEAHAPSESVPTKPVPSESVASELAARERQTSEPQAAHELQAGSEPRAQAAAPATLSMHRRLRRWRAFAVLMTLVVVAVAALVAAWRFAPDRVPPMLQPLELMRQVGVPLPAMSAPRRPAPPESRFDE